MAPSPTMTHLMGTGSLSMYNIYMLSNMSITHQVQEARGWRVRPPSRAFRWSGSADGAVVALTIFKSACRNPWAGRHGPWEFISYCSRWFSGSLFLLLSCSTLTLGFGLHDPYFIFKSPDLALVLLNLPPKSFTSICAMRISISRCARCWK